MALELVDETEGIALWRVVPFVNFEFSRQNDTLRRD
jgi:hypothetical protein